MSYTELHKMLAGKNLPLSAENENGEYVIIEGNSNCYRLTTAQHNNWCRINEYYPDGTVTETYER